MHIIEIQPDPIDASLTDWSFSICGGGPFRSGWVFNCSVEVNREDRDADLWRHKFIAYTYLESTSPPRPVWYKLKEVFVTGETEAFDDLHAALRPFLLGCVVDALFAGYHIIGTYTHEGEKWSLSDTPDTLELPDLTPSN